MKVPLDLPTGHALRRPITADVAAIDRLGAAADEALGAAPSLSEDLLRRMWARPRFTLATDAWIVEHAGDVVGYAQVWAEDPAHLSGFALVHPEHVGRGLGTALAWLIEHRSVELAIGDARLHTATIPEDAAAARLLAGRGYSFVRRFWHMEAELDTQPVDVAPPLGIRIRVIDPRVDLPVGHRVLEAAMADHWDTSSTSFEDFLDQNVRQEDFDPTLWWLAIDGDDAVGALVGAIHGDRGVVDLVGVVRSHRGRGIASTLLRTAFGAFRRRGATRARLSVDSANPTGAVRIYQRLGMRTVAAYDLWERRIQGRDA